MRAASFALRLGKVSFPRGTPTVSFSRSFATYKTSTGLAGVAVDPDALNTVHKLSQQILENVKKIPSHNEYRKSVEKWYTFIDKTVTSTTDVKAAEDTIGLGQLEEVAEYAEDELKLIEYYYDNKGWVLVEEANKYADEMALRMKDVIEFSTPPPPPAPPAAPPK